MTEVVAQTGYFDTVDVAVRDFEFGLASLKMSSYQTG
jgi:hypothetical protein